MPCSEALLDGDADCWRGAREPFGDGEHVTAATINHHPTSHPPRWLFYVCTLSKYIQFSGPLPPASTTPHQGMRARDLFQPARCSKAKSDLAQPVARCFLGPCRGGRVVNGLNPHSQPKASLQRLASGVPPCWPGISAESEPQTPAGPEQAR